MGEKPWARGNARRRIRALAADVDEGDIADTPQAMTWGAAKRVQTIALDVTIPHPLVSDWMQGGTVSSTVPPAPSDALDIDTLIHRVKAILDTLNEGEAYGPLLGCQVSLEWEQWEVSRGRRVKAASSWMGTTQHSDMRQLARETQQRIEGILSQGAGFALPQAQGRETRPTPQFKKGRGKKPPLEWITIPRLSVRWTVAPDTHYAPRGG